MIVSASPTEGGFGGYFRPGTRITAMKVNSASTAAVPRGPSLPIRPQAKANTSANRPPKAVP